MSAPLSLLRLSAASITARAKINLALHVVGRREDGYHLLSSLVAFAEHGDRIDVASATRDALGIGGPFAASLADCDPSRNLLLQALHLARRIASRFDAEIAPVAIALDKRLPVASGIGGGSADAAALLALAADAVPEMTAPLREAALGLGADVPMCLDGVPALVEGVGERSTPLAAFPRVPCLLVNPGRAVSTPEVFRHLAKRDNPPLSPLPAGGFAEVPALLDFLSSTRNDLAVASEKLVPDIAVIRAALGGAGALFARMSGSGATVFGLFGTDASARKAAERLAADHPDWWVCVTALAGTGSDSGAASR